MSVSEYKLFYSYSHHTLSLLGAMASSSSMKIIAGAFFSASSNADKAKMRSKKRNFYSTNRTLGVFGGRDSYLGVLSAYQAKKKPL